MRTTQVHFSKRFENDQYYCACEIDLPGIGVVKVSDCISRETMDRVFAEVEQLTRVKIGQEIKPVASQPAEVKHHGT